MFFPLSNTMFLYLNQRMLCYCGEVKLSYSLILKHNKEFKPFIFFICLFKTRKKVHLLCSQNLFFCNNNCKIAR
jgi:hypothetical protein